MDRMEVLNDTLRDVKMPRIPGLALRSFQGEVDYPKMLVTIQGSKDADGVERSDTLENIQHNYAHLYNCDPYRDMLFAEVDGEVVGYTRVWWMRESDGAWVGFMVGFLLPAWRRKGIGGALLHFSENRLRDIAQNQIQSGELPLGTPCFYQLISFETEVDKIALLTREGYTAVRYEYSMLRPDLEDIPEAPMPPGLEVRPAKPEHFRAIWDASQEAFRDHWGYVPAPEEEYQHWLTEPSFDPSLWKVAWQGDQVAGMVLSFIIAQENEEYQRKRGYTEGISVRRPWRRRGLARSLLAQSLVVLKERGMEEAALSVDTQNESGALRLYESVGFQVAKRFAFYRKSIPLG